MAIVYIEKGFWLHQYLAEFGYHLEDVDGVWIGYPEGNDDEINALIAAFDPLPYAIAAKVDEIKAEAAHRASNIYSFLETDPDKSIDFYKFAQDLYLSIAPEARNGLTGNLLDFKNVRDAAADAIAVVSAYTDWQVVMAYDVVNDPTWP